MPCCSLQRKQELFLKTTLIYLIPATITRATRIEFCMISAFMKFPKVSLLIDFLDEEYIHERNDEVRPTSCSTCLTPTGLQTLYFWGNRSDILFLTHLILHAPDAFSNTDRLIEKFQTNELMVVLSIID